MTLSLIERNQKQYELRQKMWKAQQTVEFCKEEITRLNREYKEQFEPDMFEMLFNDTPLADEVYGG